MGTGPRELGIHEEARQRMTIGITKAQAVIPMSLSNLKVILSPSIRGDRKTPTKHDRPGDFTSRKIQVWKIQMYKKLKW